MNAATRKAAGQKRAAFEIEDAIADTRAKIERSATTDLKAKALSALVGKPAEGIDVGEEMNKLAERIRAASRAHEITIAEQNAARWANREKAARAMLRGVRVTDYAWGAVFEGTKSALVRAGLVSAALVPAKRKTKEFQLPLNHKDGYLDACYGPIGKAIPPSWSAKCVHEDNYKNEIPRETKGNPLLNVFVEFNNHDLEVRERAQRAIAELDSADMSPKVLRVLILGIPPVPLSVQVPEQIKAARKYPTEKQRLAWHAKQSRKRK